MLTEHPISALSSYAGSFVEPPARLAWQSIVAGNTAGRLWAAGTNAAAGPLLLWDQGNNIFYLGMSPDHDTNELSHTINGEIRVAALESGPARFGVRALDEPATRRVQSVFGALLTGERRSMFWEWPAGREPAAYRARVAGVQLQPIDHALLTSDEVVGLDEVRQEVGWMWPSLERFEQYGLGIAALLDGKLVCWCTAEYVGPERCGVGIATAEEYRGQGIATATAAEFVRQAVRRGLTPCWECDADNAASARVAARLGFELLLEHRTWLGRF